MKGMPMYTHEVRAIPWVWVVEFEHMSKGEALLKESEVEK